MQNIKKIIDEIDDLCRNANKETRKALNNLKQQVQGLFDAQYNKSNYDRKFYLCNYTKLINDIKDVEKENFYIIFIKIPNLSIDFHINDENTINNQAFINTVRSRKDELMIIKNSIYKTSDFIVMLSRKKDVNDVYNELKKIKKFNKNWSGYHMTYIHFKKISSKTSKNFSYCVKQANNIFEGENKKNQDNEWS